MLPEIIQKDLLFFANKPISHMAFVFVFEEMSLYRTPSIPNHFMVVGSG